jgi:NurA-like 5'-3' nuclease
LNEEKTMSRHGFDDTVVGWDNPLQTFFADVNNVSTMLDMSRFDIQTVEELERVAVISIPDEIKERLEMDKAAAGDPTALQKMFAERLK